MFPSIIHSAAYGWLMLAGIFSIILFWSRLARSVAAGISACRKAVASSPAARTLASPKRVESSDVAKLTELFSGRLEARPIRQTGCLTPQPC